MKVICPDLFLPEKQITKHSGIKVAFDTTSLISSNRSLLEELNDDYSRVKPEENSGVHLIIHEEDERSNIDNRSTKKSKKASNIDHQSDHSLYKSKTSIDEKIADKN